MYFNQHHKNFQTATFLLVGDDGFGDLLGDLIGDVSLATALTIVF